MDKEIVKVVRAVARVAKAKLPLLDEDDLVQEGLVKAWLLGLGRAMPVGYLRTTLIHLYQNMMRKEITRLNRERDTLPLTTEEVYTEDDLALVELVESYREALTPRQFKILVELIWPSRRTEREAHAIYLRKKHTQRGPGRVMYEGVTSEAIAKSLGLSLDTVKKDAARLRRVVGRKQ